MTEKYHKVEYHPHVIKSNTYKTFVDYVKAKSTELGHFEFENARNVKFEVMKGGKFTPEALTYLNKDLKFSFKDEILKPEPSAAEASTFQNLASAVYGFKKNLSGKDLMAMCDVGVNEEDTENIVELNTTFMSPNDLNLDNSNEIEKNKRNLNEKEEIAKRSKIDSVKNLSSALVIPSSVNSSAVNSTYQISTIYNDLSKLKNIFGIYKLFKGIEPETWIERVDIYLNVNYSSNKKEIIKFFYIFLSDDYHEWFFKLSIDTFEELKEGFLEQSYDLIKSYHQMMYASEEEFINLIKSKFDINASDLQKNKLKVYFEHKFKVFGKVCPHRCSKEIIMDSIMLLDDDKVKRKYYGLRNLEISDFITSIKYNI